MVRYTLQMVDNVMTLLKCVMVVHCALKMVNCVGWMF